MARRLVARSAFAMPDATAYAIDLMSGFDFEFGDPSQDWTVESAWEIVREDMGYDDPRTVSPADIDRILNEAFAAVWRKRGGK